MVSEDVKAYVSSLADLTFNSKPLINMLTMLADENVAHAAEIVEVVENHLAKVKTDVKLPILYLIDCIVKNVGGPYTELFSHNIVSTFCSVFRVVEEKTRAEMFKLRQTWNDVFSPKKLYAIDVQIRLLDPAWPVTAPQPSSSIHFNPKFLKNPATIPNSDKTPVVPVASADPVTLDMQQQLIQKQKELLELQQKKLELELLQTKVRLREQITGGTTPILPQNVLLKPEVAKQLLPSREIKTTPDPKPVNNLVKNQKTQVSNSGPRIQPANSALVAAAVNRPTRDPRLLKQQTQPPQITSNVNVQLENKNNLESSNKIVNNKASVRDIQNDPRIKNDNNIPSQKFTDVDKSKSNVSPKSRSDKHQIKSSTSSRSSKDDSKASKSSSSSSSLESPKKSRTSNEKSSSKNLSSSSSRNRRKDDGKQFKSSNNREPKISKSDTSLPVFKDAKNSKNRNYVRRNRSPQFSPEPQDIDLRLTGPPEKQARAGSSPDKVSKIQKEPSPIPLSSMQRMDVDLRQIPPILGKKRLTDSPDRNANKRNKTEIFDVLFGNEDTDLRKLSAPSPERPPTPPPPIISLKNAENEHQAQKLDLEAVRAKLAANIKKTSPKSYKKKSEDEDYRNNQAKIVISKAENDIIKEGAMTTLQQKKLMNKIIAQIESQKLMEAKKNNFDDTMETTPISDEELDDFNDEKGKSPVHNIPSLLGDIRIIPDENINKRFGKDFRRGGPNWRGGTTRGRRPWETRQPIKPWLHQQPRGTSSFRSPFEEFDRKSPENEIVVEPCNQEDIKTITIDGLPRDIRYYDEIAVIFMNWDDPREISFQDGSRRVIFNETEIYTLNFNEPYRDIRIGDTLHQVRLGGPSREIYIDYKPYECYFGGSGITIDLDGKVTTVKLDGPPPQVKISDVRTDLVAGKIKLIIDAKTIVPIFLDARIQHFTFDNQRHSVEFLPGLKEVLINKERFEVPFGGLPKPIILKDKRHYIRFSVLPKDIKPGNVRIKGLESENFAISSPRTEENAAVSEPALPIPQRMTKTYDSNLSPENSSSNTLFQNVLQQQNLNNLDFLTNVISSSDQTGMNTSLSSYQIENNKPANQSENVSNPSSNLFNLNSINDLFQKLVASGMVTTTSTAPTHVVPKEPKNIQTPNQNKEKVKTKAKKFPPLKHISFAKPEQLKNRQGALYEKLYNGMQCSSCGTRFPPDQSVYYSQHLDWHFRQNRKGKKNARVAASRRWYYSVNDWQNYEEIENLEEREKNYFDQQQQQDENVGNAAVEDTEQPSVNADPELQDICEVCGDKFEIFFNEDKEEWQFRNAIRNDDKIYHPICFEEYQQSLQNEEANKSIESNRIPGIEIVLDDDEEVEKSSEIVDEVVLDESDESKLTSEEKKEEVSSEPLEYEEQDDDVIIKEEEIEQIVLDDDDDKMDEDDDEMTQISSVSSSRATSPKNNEQPEIIDDGFVDVNEGLLMLKNGGEIKVKTEPIDEDEQPNHEFETSIPDEHETTVDVQEEARENEMEVDQQPLASFLPSIDGNLEMEASAPAPVVSVSGKIKINIHKPLPVISSKDNYKDVRSEKDKIPETMIDPSQPLPPGEEPNLLKLKPALQGVELKQMPLVQKGSELTGMCSIM